MSDFDRPLSYDIEQQGRAPVSAYRRGATAADEAREVAEIVGEKRPRGPRICDCPFSMLHYKDEAGGTLCTDCPKRRDGGRSEP